MFTRPNYTGLDSVLKINDRIEDLEPVDIRRQSLSSNAMKRCSDQMVTPTTIEEVIQEEESEQTQVSIHVTNLWSFSNQVYSELYTKTYN